MNFYPGAIANHSIHKILLEDTDHTRFTITSHWSFYSFHPQAQNHFERVCGCVESKLYPEVLCQMAETLCLQAEESDLFDQIVPDQDDLFVDSSPHGSDGLTVSPTWPVKSNVSKFFHFLKQLMSPWMI